MVYIAGNGSLMPRVHIHLENYEDDLPGKRLTLFFHKRLAASITGKEVGRSLSDGVREMQEPIF
jgi:hypothetical protein